MNYRALPDSIAASFLRYAEENGDLQVLGDHQYGYLEHPETTLEPDTSPLGPGDAAYDYLKGVSTAT